MTRAEDAPYPWHAAALPESATRPTRPTIQGRRAGLVTRGLANVLDLLVVLVLLGAGYAAVAAGRFLLDPPSFHFPAPGVGPAVLLGEAVAVVYLTVSWAVSGRTYGNGVLGLRVVNGRGEQLRWAGAAVRALFCVIVPIGLLWVLVSRQNRSLQDVVLRTSVIYDWRPTA